VLPSSFVTARRLTWSPFIPTRRTTLSLTKSIQGNRGFGLELRENHQTQLSGSGLTGAVLIINISAQESRTTMVGERPVLTLAGAPEIPGTTSPVINMIIIFRSFARKLKYKCC